MKRNFYFLFFVVCVCVMTSFLVSCGGDDPAPTPTPTPTGTMFDACNYENMPLNGVQYIQIWWFKENEDEVPQFACLLPYTTSIMQGKSSITYKSESLGGDLVDKMAGFWTADNQEMSVADINLTFEVLEGIDRYKVTCSFDTISQTFARGTITFTFEGLARNQSYWREDREMTTQNFTFDQIMDYEDTTWRVTDGLDTTYVYLFSIRFGNAAGDEAVITFYDSVKNPNTGISEGEYTFNSGPSYKATQGSPGVDDNDKPLSDFVYSRETKSTWFLLLGKITVSLKPGTTDVVIIRGETKSYGYSTINFTYEGKIPVNGVQTSMPERTTSFRNKAATCKMQKR